MYKIKLPCISRCAAAHDPPPRFILLLRSEKRRKRIQNESKMESRRGLDTSLGRIWRSPRRVGARPREAPERDPSRRGARRGSKFSQSVAGMHDFGVCVHTLWWFSDLGSEGALRSVKNITRSQWGLLKND